MKKLLIALTASFMLIGASSITYAQNESSSESTESNETAKERETANVRTNDTFGEDLDEGNDYRGINEASFPTLTIANIRYNDEYLYVDIQADIGHGHIPKTYDEILTDGWLINVYQGETNNKKSDLVLLRPRYNNLPPELEGDLLVPELRSTVKKDANTREHGIIFTIPYQLELSLDEAARIIFEFGDEEVEVELEIDNPVI